MMKKNVLFTFIALLLAVNVFPQKNGEIKKFSSLTRLSPNQLEKLWKAKEINLLNITLTNDSMSYNGHIQTTKTFLSKDGDVWMKMNIITIKEKERTISVYTFSFCEEEFFPTKYNEGEVFLWPKNFGKEYLIKSNKNSFLVVSATGITRKNLK